VKDAHRAGARVLASGAQPIEIATGPMELRLPGHGQPVAPGARRIGFGECVGTVSG